MDIFGDRQFVEIPGSETHALPPDADEPMRCAFGDPDFGSLYVTTGTGELYRVKSIGRKGIKG